MSRVADLMILNVLWIICCLPIVTIGAATTALHYVTLKMVKNEESYIVKSYFKSFRENFKQSTLIWIIMFVLFLIFVFDLIILGSITFQFSNIIRYVILAMIFVYVMVLLYVFPVTSKFYNSTKNIFKNSFLMSIKHLPYTLLMLVITIGPFIILLFVSGAFQYGLLIFILVGFSLIAFCNSYFFNKIFDRYIPKEEDEEINTEEDCVPEES